MKAWWLRPAIRLVAALVLPLAVPGILTALIWALPGDPATRVCPTAACAASGLAARWHLDQGAWGFYTAWLSNAVQGDFGASWFVMQGDSVTGLLAESIPTTVVLLLAGMLPLVIGAVGAGSGVLPRRADGPLQGVGLAPVVIFALFCEAVITLRFGSGAFGDEATRWRIALGATVLGLADGALAGAVSGVRALFRSERKQRYVQVAVLRGEGVLANMLPNLAPALLGQMRARALHLMSGLVVVEVVLKINGLGDLLWQGTLKQDFGVVLAAATAFATISAALLLLQAVGEIFVAMRVRSAPVVALTGAA